MLSVRETMELYGHDVGYFESDKKELFARWEESRNNQTNKKILCTCWAHLGFGLYCPPVPPTFHYDGYNVGHDHAMEWMVLGCSCH